MLVAMRLGGFARIRRKGKDIHGSRPGLLWEPQIHFNNGK
jgi:hypothetical protein